MSKNFELKKQAVSEITDKFKEAKGVVVVNYSGLTVEQVTALRAQCRAAKVDYCVLKNTLARRALDDLKITGLDDVLNGPSAFAFGMEDVVAPPRSSASSSPRPRPKPSR
jgi:large subunit ribosomal protein L10